MVIKILPNIFLNDHLLAPVTSVSMPHPSKCKTSFPCLVNSVHSPLSEAYNTLSKKFHTALWSAPIVFKNIIKFNIPVYASYVFPYFFLYMTMRFWRTGHRMLLHVSIYILLCADAGNKINIMFINKWECN